jgi:hypothetical protein
MSDLVRGKATVCGVCRTAILRRRVFPSRKIRLPALPWGQKLYFDLRDRGYRTILLPDRLASTYVVHLAHATQMLNAAEFGFDRVARKWRRVMGPWLTSESFQALLRDDRLDR